eukprot:9697331-Prorocentrum_lima.AAC.1
MKSGGPDAPGRTTGSPIDELSPAPTGAVSACGPGSCLGPRSLAGCRPGSGEGSASGKSTGTRCRPPSCTTS